MIMATVLIYGTMTCPYCMSAKQLLQAKGIEYQEILVDKEPAKKAEMLAISNGRRTVPQIFINGKHVGGFDDLEKLQSSGQLDKLLQD